jgi:hypothetical protein
MVEKTKKEIPKNEKDGIAIYIDLSEEYGSSKLNPYNN